MRACWAATLLVLVQPSPASCATCRDTSVVPQVLALTHRRLRKSPCVRQPFVETSGSIAFSSLCSFPGNCALFLCVSSRVHSTSPLDPPDFDLVVRGPSDGRGYISRRITGISCCGLSRDIYSRAACDARRSDGRSEIRVNGRNPLTFPKQQPTIPFRHTTADNWNCH